MRDPENGQYLSVHSTHNNSHSCVALIISLPFLTFNHSLTCSNLNCSDILNCQSKSKADWDIEVPLAEVGVGGNILDEWLLSGPLSG